MGITLDLGTGNQVNTTAPEENNDISTIQSVLAGIGSGLI